MQEVFMNAPPLIPVLLADEIDAEAEEITKILQADGSFDVVRVKSIDTVMENLQKRNIDLLLLAIALSGGADFDKIAEIHASAPDVAIVLVADPQQAATAARAIRAGAQDYYVCGQTIPGSLLRIIQNARERALLQQALRDSEDRYRDLVENSEDLICTHDIKGNLLSVNARACRLLGYSPEDWRGKNMRQVLAPEIRDQFDSYLEEILTKGFSKGLMVVLTASGEKRIWEFNNSLRLDGVATPIVRGLAHDVTEQKRAEKLLREHAAKLQEQTRLLEESLSLLRATLDSTADGILVVDLKGKIVTWNQRFVDLWGIPESLLARKSDDLALEFVLQNLKYPDQFLRKVRQLYEDVEAESHDILEFKDGRIFERYSRPQRVGNKSIGRVWSFRDVSKREHAAEALRRSEQKYRTLFEESKDVVFISTPDGRILDINPAGMEMFGYTSKDDLVNVDVRDHFTNAADRERYKTAIREKGFVKDFELTLIGKGGAKMDVLETSTAVRDEKGAIVAYHGILRDMSEIKSLQQQIAQLQRIETIGRLAGGIAHDFNNILMAIYGTCDLLMFRLPEGDSIRADVEQILKAAERGASLTRQMLAFSRKQILSPKVLELKRLLLNMENMIRRLMGDDIELILDLGSDVGNVLADPVQVEQVIMNLVVNARDAMPYGGRLMIETGNAVMDEDFVRLHAGSVPGTYVLMSFDDTGYGMDKTTLSRVFEPFFTTKEVGKGTGLGLASVYGVVKQSGGYILVSSELGRGSSFKIYLPLVDRAAEEEAKENTGSATREKTITILIVDDSESVRKIMSHMLQIRGYNVLEAESGEQALAISRAFNGVIHLLITDVLMPQMGGPELARIITSERSDLRVLFMSGYPEKEIHLKETMPEYSVFLSKPASIDTIIQKIAQIFEQ